MLDTYMIGTTISHYLVVEKLGAGGMGVVYKARDLNLDRFVALKVVADHLLNSRFRARLVREAKLAASLNHPNIAHVYDVGEADGVCYIAMEFVEGETLRRRMTAPDSALPELIRNLLEVADALQAAHDKGVIHCDLKPENIMVSPAGRTRVLDFGLARLLNERRREEAQALGADGATLTMSSLWADEFFEGTLGYMSPEQAEGKKPEASSDIFSFGCILFEIATHEVPFKSSSPLRSLHSLLYDPVPRLEERQRVVHPELQPVLDLCLAKDPGQRASSFAAVKLELEKIVEITPSVRQPRLAGPLHVFSGRNRARLAAASVLVAVLIVVILVLYLRTPDKPTAQSSSGEIASVAVIPFLNVGGAPDVNFLSDGLSEGLINALAQLPTLKVIARSSSFQFKSDGLNVRNVARTLGVQALITGRISERDGDLRVSAELVKGSDGTALWGAQYHPRPDELASVQEQIVREISNRLRTPARQPKAVGLTESSGVNPEAYSLMLRGRYEMRLYNPQSTRKAIDYYQEALAVDPGFALAHAELANSYRLLSGAGILKPSEAMPLAEAAAMRAIAVKGNLPQGHAVLADIRRDQWQWPTAEREYSRALELNPNLVSARTGFAIYLTLIGKRERAIQEVLKASELDPIGVPTAINTGAVFYNCRRYKEAIRELKRSAALDPSASALWTWIGIVYGGSGQYTAAVEAYQQAMRLGDRTAATQCDYAYSLAKSNKRKEALTILQSLQSSKEFIPPSALAIVFVGLGQTERALQLLETAYGNRDQLLQYIGVESQFDSLRGEPRFQTLLAKLGLPG